MGGFNSAMAAKPAAQANNDFFTGSGDSKSLREEGTAWPTQRADLQTSSGMSAAQTPSAALSRSLLENSSSTAASGRTWPSETAGGRARNGDGWLGASAKIAQPPAPRQDERQVPQSGLLTSFAEMPRPSKPSNPPFPFSAEAAKGTGMEAGFPGGVERKGQGGILEMMAGYPQWREDYLRNYDRRQQEILNAAAPKPNPSLTYASNEQTAEEQRPRSDALGKRGLVSTNPENPTYPDQGNFAEKLWGPRVTAKPFVDEPRKGTYYFGGAGMDGAYIDDMVKAMRENGVGNSQAVDRSKWSIHEKVDAPMTLLRRNRDGASTDFSQFGKDGKQFNMVGYSHGGLQAAQAAADYASVGGKVDHLVLVGTPISQEFLDKLKNNPNIGKVIVKNIEGQGDPIHAGMGAGGQIMSLPKLMEDQKKGDDGKRGFGHFYYAGSGAEGTARRRELAKQLYDWGLR